MAGETMRFRNPAGHAGLLNNLFGLINSLAGFLESRLRLFTQESRVALVHIFVLAACLVGAAILVLFGYVFLIASVIAGLAYALRISWVWISLAAAGLHFVLAIVCVVIAKNRMKQSIFEATTAELKKDREWLKKLDKKDHSTN
jgi:uncharacterized membrane protein YqjE